MLTEIVVTEIMDRVLQMLVESRAYSTGRLICHQYSHCFKLSSFSLKLFLFLKNLLRFYILLHILYFSTLLNMIRARSEYTNVTRLLLVPLVYGINCAVLVTGVLSNMVWQLRLLYTYLPALLGSTRIWRRHSPRFVCATWKLYWFFACQSEETRSVASTTFWNVRESTTQRAGEKEVTCLVTSQRKYFSFISQLASSLSITHTIYTLFVICLS